MRFYSTNWGRNVIDFYHTLTAYVKTEFINFRRADLIAPQGNHNIYKPLNIQTTLLPQVIEYMINMCLSS